MPPIQPPNHWLFQLANAALLVSYLSPHILVLRVALTVGAVCFSLWGFVVLYVSLDTGIYNAIFAIINAYYAVRIIYGYRRIKFARLEHETLYVNMFGPGKYNLPRQRFKQLVQSSAYIRTLQKDTFYCHTGDDVSLLSILISGRIRVLAKDADGTEIECNSIDPFEFLDSPEFLNRGKKDNKYAISMKAAEDCKYLYWPIENLEKVFAQEPELAVCINSLIGGDIAKKLFNLNDVVVHSRRPKDKAVSETTSTPSESKVEDASTDRLLTASDIAAVKRRTMTLDGTSFECEVRLITKRSHPKAILTPSATPLSATTTPAASGGDAGACSTNVRALNSPANSSFSEHLIAYQPLGFVVLSRSVTYSDVRSSIREELDNVPNQFRFYRLILPPTGFMSSLMSGLTGAASYSPRPTASLMDDGSAADTAPMLASRADTDLSPRRVGSRAPLLPAASAGLLLPDPSNFVPIGTRQESVLHVLSAAEAEQPAPFKTVYILKRDEEDIVDDLVAVRTTSGEIRVPILSPDT